MMSLIQQLARSIALMVGSGILLLASVRAADDRNSSPEMEKELIAILQSDAPGGDKAIACKKLAIHGSAAAVSELAKLLPDPQLASWSRIALESIPGTEADDALIAATASLEGRLLVGTINSIGVRRATMAAAGITKLLQHSDPQVASAAAVALGRIGGDDPTRTLRQALASSAGEVRSAIAEGCILSAERLWADGQSAAAVEIYDEIRKTDLPTQRVIEATRGAILARGQGGIPLLVEQLHSSDKKFFKLALGTAREFPGSEIDPVLASEMASASPDRAALIIQAMADRKDTVILAAVLKAAESGDKLVRASAINALARAGNISCLDTLLKCALDADSDIAVAAKATLADLPGENVDSQIVQMLPKSADGMRTVMLELAGKRRISAAVSELLKALNHSDAIVRHTALAALGETIAPDQLKLLIQQVLSPEHPEDASVALVALKSASIRMPDREVCATELAAAADRATAVPKKIDLLQILGAVGGTKALTAVGLAAKNADPQLQDTSSRLLGEWMTEDAAPVLLDLAKTPGNQYQVRALRGYIRIARQFVLPEEQRVEMCRKAIDAARQPAEKKLVLEVLKRYPTTESLKLAISLMAVPDLKADASPAVLIIGSKLSGKGVDVKTLLASVGFDRIRLEIVKAEYGADNSMKDVTTLLQKQSGDLPLITLAASDYNSAFGGDPAPGSPKKLKIKYRINDRDGEAAFDENALIVLPLPGQPNPK